MGLGGSSGEGLGGEDADSNTEDSPADQADLTWRSGGSQGESLPPVPRDEAPEEAASQADDAPHGRESHPEPGSAPDAALMPSANKDAEEAAAADADSPRSHPGTLPNAAASAASTPSAARTLSAPAARASANTSPLQTRPRTSEASDADSEAGPSSPSHEPSSRSPGAHGVPKTGGGAPSKGRHSRKSSL